MSNAATRPATQSDEAPRPGTLGLPPHDRLPVELLEAQALTALLDLTERALAAPPLPEPFAFSGGVTTYERHMGGVIELTWKVTYWGQPGDATELTLDEATLDGREFPMRDHEAPSEWVDRAYAVMDSEWERVARREC